jgi:hypothetical protein
MTDTILAKVFCQVDTVRGFRYLDDAGKIMNRYADAFPDFNVGITGLTMKNPGGVIEELRVSATQIWIAFDHPPDSDDLRRDAVAHLLSIADLIGVSHAKRFGLRTHRLLPVGGVDLKKRFDAAITPSWTHVTGQINGSESIFKVVDPDRLIRVSSVERVPDAADWMPEVAVLIDIDVSRTGQEMALSDLDAFIDGAMESTDSTTGEIADQLSEVVSDG